jgi:hypothetical protein
MIEKVCSSQYFFKSIKPLSLVGTVAILKIISFFPLSLQAQQKENWRASAETVDKLSKARPEFNFREENVPAYTLPDVLTSVKGKAVTNSKEWEASRRAEILELFTTQVYGRVPARAYKKTIRIVKENPKAMNGAATLKLIDITIEANAKSLTIHLGLFTPNNISKPVPAFLLISNRPPENIDFTRQKKADYWPAEEIISRGYAVAAFYNADVDPDEHDNFQNGIHGLLDSTRTKESWGTIAAWAWGASRCMDYLVTDKNIAADKVAVVSHSRGGKTALWAGATDRRFALVIGNDAGCGGSSLNRRVFGETIAQINKTFPHWFCENYKAYSNNEDSLLVDQHMLMALIAPRALYIASADEDLWADPKGQFLSVYHAVPVYKMYNNITKLPLKVPPLDKPVISGKLAYHVRSGGHNLTLKDWNYFMDFSDVIFLKTK